MSPLSSTGECLAARFMAVQPAQVHAVLCCAAAEHMWGDSTEAPGAGLGARGEDVTWS